MSHNRGLTVRSVCERVSSTRYNFRTLGNLLYCRRRKSHKQVSLSLFHIIASQAEVEETLKRIESHKGVIGTLVVNAEGKIAG